MSTRKADNADVALVLEGTFPYVSGGVSSWINQIIRAYPDIRFAIVFLGSRREDYKEFKYQLPDNVVHFEEHYLYANLNAHHQPAMRDGDRQAFDLIDQLIDTLHLGPGRCFARWHWRCAPAASCRSKIFSTANVPGKSSATSTATTAATRLSSISSGPCASCSSPCGCSLA